jgi:hypothetical protein
MLFEVFQVNFSRTKKLFSPKFLACSNLAIFDSSWPDILKTLIIFCFIQYLSYSYPLKYCYMTNKMPKAAFQFFLGALMLTFVATACNNDKGKKEKETTIDTLVPKPVVPDSITKKPTETGD